MFPKVTSVLLLDGIDDVCGQILKEKGIAVTVKGKQTNEELAAIIGEYDAVVVRSATKVNADALKAGAARKLRLVGRAGTGTDNIDVVAATANGVIVMNTPGGNTISAAEHTCALICSLARFLPQACASLKAGNWDRKKYMGNELLGKTLAIVGLGRIGKEVAARMQSFGMVTIGYDPFVSKEDGQKFNIEVMELDELWPKADYITVHTPLLPHTRNLIGREVLNEKCKKGVKIINVARGGIVDEDALLDSLKSGRCGGAGLDVFVNEPPTDFELCSHSKVVCTPHLGASTQEAQKRVAQEIADQILKGMNGGPVIGLVNAHGLTVYSTSDGADWMDLAIKLGNVASAFFENKGSVTISSETSGAKYERYHKQIGSGIMAGYLNTDLIKAASIAGSLGISEPVCKLTSNPLGLLVENYQVIKVTSAGKKISVGGTSVDGMKLIISVDGISLSSPIALAASQDIIIMKGSDSDLNNVISSLVKSSVEIRSFAKAPGKDNSYFLIVTGKSESRQLMSVSKSITGVASF